MDDKAIAYEVFEPINPGRADYDHLRPLTYLNTDAFVLVYSIVNPTSYENLRAKWYPDVTHHAPAARIILAALKTDLRDNKEWTKILKDKGCKAISTAEGEQLASEIHADAFIEVSSLCNYNVKESFELAVHAILHAPVKKNKKVRSGCVIL